MRGFGARGERTASAIRKAGPRRSLDVRSAGGANRVSRSEGGTARGARGSERGESEQRQPFGERDCEGHSAVQSVGRANSASRSASGATKGTRRSEREENEQRQPFGERGEKWAASAVRSTGLRAALAMGAITIWGTALAMLVVARDGRR